MTDELQKLKDILHSEEILLAQYKRHVGQNAAVDANYQHKLEDVARIKTRIAELEGERKEKT